jgi:transcriptional regulator with XRE-family HTH domain
VEKLYNARRQAQLTATELARRSGVHRTTIRRAELGKRSLVTRNLVKIAKALDVKPEELL